MQKEAKFGIKLRHWLRVNPKFSMCIEIKQTDKNTFNLKNITDDQINFGVAVRDSKSGVLVRVSSGTVGASDYIYLRNFPSFFAIQFPKGFSIIPADLINIEKNKKPSLTWERACDIGTIVVHN